MLRRHLGIAGAGRSTTEPSPAASAASSTSLTRKGREILEAAGAASELRFFAHRCDAKLGTEVAAFGQAARGSVECEGECCHACCNCALPRYETASLNQGSPSP